MPAVIPTDLAYRILRLEEKLDSYQRLHAEELDQIRQALRELKAQVLALEPTNRPDATTSRATD